jgi:hypothetical protein
MGFEGESKSGFKLLDLKINFQLVRLKTPIKIMETAITSFQTLKKKKSIITLKNLKSNLIKNNYGPIYFSRPIK